MSASSNAPDTGDPSAPHDGAGGRLAASLLEILAARQAADATMVAMLIELRRAARASGGAYFRRSADRADRAERVAVDGDVALAELLAPSVDVLCDAMLEGDDGARRVATRPLGDRTALLFARRSGGRVGVLALLIDGDDALSDADRADLELGVAALDVVARDDAKPAEARGDDDDRLRASVVERLGLGVLMFDANDALVLANGPYAALFPALAETAAPGAPYAELIAAEVKLLNRADADRDVLDRRLRERLRRHAAGETFSIEAELRPDLWLQIDERRLDDGGVVIAYTDVSEIRRREEDVQQRALHDPLTNLPNRVLLRRRLEQAFAEARRLETKVAVLYVDLDDFKTVNDTLGHPVGDRLLCDAVARIASALRSSDTVARLGGDEFAVVMRNVVSEEPVVDAAERIVEAVSAPFDFDGQLAKIGASVGAVICEPDEYDADAALRDADLALYGAKTDGKRRFRLFERRMGDRAAARRRLEQELRGAIENDEFELFYQPLVEAQTSALSGFEALLRWRRPRSGLTAPDDFLELAEETGLIVPIGEWVLRSACRSARGWGDRYRVAVNVSPLELERAGNDRLVEKVLGETGLDPRRLEIEITEKALMREGASALDALTRLKEIGVRIVLDDFGDGHSSINALKRFPFDKIKIDGGVLLGLAEDTAARATFRAIAELGVTLGVETTAEGVETLAQLDYALNEGCTEVQGFHYGGAIPSAEVDDVILEFKRSEELAQRRERVVLV